MPEFLTTSGLNYHLEKLLQEAELEILLISPYIKLAPKIRQLLVERRQAGVKITVACRVENLQESQESLESLAECADPVLDLPRLHAKCYVSERGAIVGSMNLHESSQRNNSEMGIYVRNAEDDAALYSKVLDEARRLCAMSSACPDVEPAFPPLVVGQKYAKPDLGKRFGFDHTKGAGINVAANGDLVLFNNNSAINHKTACGLDYCGQETGTPEQELLYGNLSLYNCWGDPAKAIHLFEKSVYLGEHFVSDEPKKEEGKWRFPLSKK